MSEIQVASRYAKSLIDLAQEQNVLEKVREDIASFVATLKENSQLRAVLANPIITPDKKFAILSQLFGENSHPMILGFFKIVTNKGRSEILFSTAKEFLSEYDQLKGIVNATVTSAAPLSEENIIKIVNAVQDATRGKVHLTTKVNPELIGGFVLKVGDKQFDTSISSSLNKLKKEFAQKFY
ncbi:MAG TPA: ATP synthase F1 subunit delta [Sphingobacteriaceae bacterium]